MPNWCYVNAKFYSDNKDRIKRLKEELLNDKDFSYDKVIKRPYIFAEFDKEGNFIKESENGVSVIKDEDINFSNRQYVNLPDSIEYNGSVWNDKYKGYKAFNWYNWNVDNWGVKWSANGNDCSFYYYDNEIELSFDAPWYYPKEVLEAICEQYKVSCNFSAEECGCAIYEIGSFEYDDEYDNVSGYIDEYDTEVDFVLALGDTDRKVFDCLDCSELFIDDYPVLSHLKLQCPECGSTNVVRYNVD